MVWLQLSAETLESHQLEHGCTVGYVSGGKKNLRLSEAVFLKDMNVLTGLVSSLIVKDKSTRLLFATGWLCIRISKTVIKTFKQWGAVRRLGGEKALALQV